MFNLLTRDTLTRSVLIAVFAGATAFQANAQTGDAQLALVDPLKKLLPKTIERFAPGGLSEEEEACEEEKPVVVYFRRAKRISAAYEGYAIELTSSDRPLLHDNPLFKQFGNIVYDRTKTGQYAYLIHVPFTNKKSVESFLESVIKPKSPHARIVEYEDGKMRG